MFVHDTIDLSLINMFLLSTVFMNMSYLGDGLTNAVVFDWLGFGEMEDLDLGSVTCEGLL